MLDFATIAVNKDTQWCHK